jgi:acetyltransferase-like isoleucine patch superfamily enzyme
MALIEVLPTVWVSDRAKLGSNVCFGRNVKIHGPAEIGSDSIIEDFVTIGHPTPGEVKEAGRSSTHTTPASLDWLDDFIQSTVTIGAGSIIRGPAVIYSDVGIGRGFDCAHNVTIREGCRLGSECYLKVNTELRRNVMVGNNAALAGTVGDNSKICDGVTSFGNLIHKYDQVRRGVTELGPTLKDGVFVGRGASVIGPVSLGEFAYIAAGAIVTKDVPPGVLVMGVAASFYPEASPSLKTQNVTLGGGWL